MHDPIMKALFVAKRYADGGRAPGEGEIRSYDPPWYDKAAYAVSDYLYGPEARAPETQWIKRLVGPENPFNVPAMATEAGRTIGHGLNAGDPASIGMGSAMAAMAAMPSAKGAMGALKRVENPIRAYHGSPHDFDRFDMSKIGTGEGAQAYGHGLYFAENEGVAKQYRDRLSTFDPYGARRPKIATVDGVPAWNINQDVWEVADQMASRGITNIDDLISHLKEKLVNVTNKNRESVFSELLRQAEDVAPVIRGKTVKFDNGRMYEVNIHASPDDFLDWDKPLSQQSEKVRGALEPDLRRYYGSQYEPQVSLYADKPVTDLLRAVNPRDPMGERVSAQMAERGVAGIRYLDQGSRTAGEGSRNLVVFDPSIIEILRKYGLLGTLGGASAYGAFNAPPAEAKQ